MHIQTFIAVSKCDDEKTNHSLPLLPQVLHHSGSQNRSGGLRFDYFLKFFIIVEVKTVVAVFERYQCLCEIKTTCCWLDGTLGVCGIRGGRVFCSAHASCIAKLFCQSRNQSGPNSQNHAFSCIGRPLIQSHMSMQLSSVWQQTSCHATAQRSHAQPLGVPLALQIVDLQMFS